MTDTAMDTMESKTYTQQHSEVNGRNVWHYMIATPIGHIHVVEYEQRGKELARTLIDEDNDKAEKLFAKYTRAILANRL